MIYNEAVAHVVKSIVEEKEGGTFSTHGASVPTTGFWVGGVVDPTVVTPDHDREHLAYLVQQKIVESQTEWVGYWLDWETNLYHLDGVSWTEDAAQAVKWAQDRGEKAIHSIANGVDLWL